MRQLRNCLIGHEPNSYIVFPPEDNEERYKKNLEKLGPDWIYSKELVDYKFNSRGQRCIEIEELTEGYLLFAGCSHTLGTGVKLENTYAYLTAKHFNKTYYNLAMGGTCPETTMLNIIGFFSIVKHFPSAIILQWPDFNRFFHVSKTNDMITYNPANGADITYKMLLREDIPLKKNTFYREYTLRYLKNIGIDKIIEVVDQGISGHNTTKISFLNPIDKARDMSHAGNLSNRERANTVIEALTKIL